ncbi:membrane peptidoglycan carboxypeptidase [Streptomyces griseochromogenes]|uniref:Membrane peptidoglycan carboxypeptidase n=1 Tax=Streptomyces griseochromogenes TaxID=68214 RepID=A0A1B1AP67_9ACTN|nr:transglycosylase domain-containing protein [Streptomyces griseochromogenes]ANP48315.1 penicillin-binding protein [Streptomyces griseochromogenes]MBP2050746.1 membrane peptidoglycan carboxypeptidase [Streptomyces griseochromogenes]
MKRLLVHLRRRRGRWVRRVLVALLALFLALVGTVWVAYELTTIPAPHPETVSQSTVFLDAGGEYLGRRGPVDRQDVDLSQVPRHVQDAVIAAENRSFRTDSGVSPSAIVRAAVATVSGGERQGGSTITQQYVKNALLSPEQSLTRKAREALISLKLDRTRSKDQILEGYLNTVYFGRGAAGIESAARNYFGVDAKDLTVSQGAALAAIINRPTYYERAGSDAKVTATLQKRWRWVLDAMRSSGGITLAQRSSAAFPAFRFYPPGASDGQRQYLIDAAAAEAARRLGISQDQLARGGYTVRTTFDLSTQYAVSEQVRERGRALGLPKDTRLHAAVIAMVPGDGAVRVLYGGEDYAHQPFNDALSGAVEAGTALRPFAKRWLGAPLTRLPDTAAPTPMAVASAYATAAADGTYATPYTVARITRGGRTVYTAHPDRHSAMAPGMAAVMAKQASAGPQPTYTGGAGTGPGTRTLWQSVYTPRLALTTAVFGEHPAAKGRPARPAHLPASVVNLATGVRSEVFAPPAPALSAG